MPPESGDPAYLWDMLDAAEAVLRFAGRSTFADYRQNPLLKAAIERKLEVLGEAARKVSDSLKRAHPEIPWQKIIAQRHILAHEYGEIEDDAIWQVVEIHIPSLIALLKPLVPPSPE